MPLWNRYVSSGPSRRSARSIERIRHSLHERERFFTVPYTVSNVYSNSTYLFNDKYPTETAQGSPSAEAATHQIRPQQPTSSTVKSQATSRDTAAARLQGEPNHRSTRDSRTHQPKRRGGTHTLKYSTENTRGDGDGSGSVGAGVHPRRSGRSGGREKFTQKITRTRLLSDRKSVV